MATLRDIKRRITGVSNTAKITQAMRMVSAAKLRRAQESIVSARPYVRKLEEILLNLVEAAGEEYNNPLIQKRQAVRNIAVVVITSDRGLCGSFNTNLLRFVNRFIIEDLPQQYPGANITVIPVGRKGCGFYSKSPVPTIKEYPGVFADLKFDIAKDIIGILTKGFINQEIDKVLVFFNEFKNLISQVPSFVSLLPIEPATRPVDTQEKHKVNYIYEPGQTLILDELLPRHLDIQLWRTLLESNAAEQAARMMAMENATNNARDLISSLELLYNKERQAAITKEMLEIVGGANAAIRSSSSPDARWMRLMLSRRRRSCRWCSFTWAGWGLVCRRWVCAWGTNAWARFSAARCGGPSA
jgi:F-type H+-transporting ATPase subunit gamma